MTTPTDAESQTSGAGADEARISVESMERFVKVFEASARRWEFVVYPALFAFIVLAAYGFFLIYSLTGDIRAMARSIDPDMGYHMRIMTESIENLNATMQLVSADMRRVSANIEDVTAHMEEVSAKMEALEPMRVHMANMDQSMRTMTVSNDMMRRDMGRMSHNVARPMSFMNTFMPW